MSNTQPPFLTVVQTPTDDTRLAETCGSLNPLSLALLVAARLDDLPGDNIGDLRGEMLAISKNPGDWPVFLNNLLAILRDTQPTPAQAALDGPGTLQDPA